MQNTASKVVYASSWFALVLAALISFLWCEIALEKDGYMAFLFLFIGPGFSVLGLFLGIIPSAVFYSRRKQPRDLMTLRIWSSSVVIVAGETFLLCSGVLGGLRVA